MDRGLNELLKWGIENSTTSTTATAATTTNGDSNGAVNGATAARPANSDLNQEVLAALLGGPSDADLMKEAIAVVSSTDPEVTLENKLIAFDNFEQLIESLDNANNLGPLSLWSPLLLLLEHEERELRRMAAWCVGTAVQNNEPSQERLVAMGGVPRVVALATAAGEHDDVRRKAVYALSSAVRNYQPAMDVAVEHLARRGAHGGEKVDASNMDAVDEIIDKLRKEVPAPVPA